MIKTAQCLLAMLLVAMPAIGIADDERGEQIRWVATLDEPEFYCLDLAGWGRHLQLDDPLQTHTCKLQGREDPLFKFIDGRLTLAHFNRCLQVAGSSQTTLAGSAILARDCSGHLLQRHTLDNEGRIRLTDTEFCLVAGAESTEASGSSHFWRTLTVADCKRATDTLVTWQVGPAGSE